MKTMVLEGASKEETLVIKLRHQANHKEVWLCEGVYMWVSERGMSLSRATAI